MIRRKVAVVFAVMVLVVVQMVSPVYSECADNADCPAGMTCINGLCSYPVLLERPGTKRIAGQILGVVASISPLAGHFWTGNSGQGGCSQRSGTLAPAPPIRNRATWTSFPFSQNRRPSTNRAGSFPIPLAGSPCRQARFASLRCGHSTRVLR